jgi:hypothetical protein
MSCQEANITKKRRIGDDTVSNFLMLCKALRINKKIIQIGIFY